MILTHCVSVFFGKFWWGSKYLFPFLTSWEVFQWYHRSTYVAHNSDCIKYSCLIKISICKIRGRSKEAAGRERAGYGWVRSKAIKRGRSSSRINVPAYSYSLLQCWITMFKNIPSSVLFPHKTWRCFYLNILEESINVTWACI